MIDSGIETRPKALSKRIELAFWDMYVDLLTRSKFMRGIFQFFVTFFLKTNLKNFIKLSLLAMLLGSITGVLIALGWNAYRLYSGI